ncbi:putative ankyrin repeat protein RF_0381 isoform X2 [Portunus trituberculatus]|uniref:putative ankyrin repeat protein RF_0381 isoform X2 n=1 Tax=Portunus trituberculatus TaxID=210409 RepID=UPI001E1CD395|nr:putative ankyrin repeat protein RF_0381 isoform X2 [Portunus trituberculatus]
MGLGDELLLWSLIENSEKHLRTALEYGANVNLTSPTGSCPLHVAALLDLPWLIRILLDHKATVDQKDESGYTPLMVAALNGKTDAARVLLSMGADPNMKRPSNGETALHLAMNSKSRTVVGTLLDADADINAQTSDRKFTPLHLAAWFNAGNLVSLLLEDPLCDATILDSAERTAAIVATEKSNHHVAEHLRLFAMTKSVADKELLSAVMELDNEAAKKALMGGANANLCFHVAAMKGSVPLIKILLDHQANVDEINSLGITPLMVAALNGNTDAVKELLLNGAKVNQKGIDNEIALHLAMKGGSHGVVNELLEKGADINAQTKSKKFTPLHFAVHFNDQYLRKVLEMHTKCDATIVDWKDRTADQLAEERGHQHETLPDTPDGKMIKSERVSENVYKVTSPPRGKVLVFNYENFEKKEDYRKGAVWDSKKVEKLFAKMGYQVNSYHNKKYQETIDILNSFRRSEEMAKVDCIVVCVLSHGIRHDTFMTSDNRLMTVDEIHSYFTDDKCPHLKGKPKLFLFNYCRDTNSQDDLKTQGSRENPPLEDHITIYATIEGKYALRNPWKGTYFTEAMTKMLSQYADFLHVAKLAEKMREYMKIINGPEISVVDETKKKFYLNLHATSD